MAHNCGNTAPEMLRTILPYALLLAVAGLAIQWLRSRFLVEAIPFEAYIASIAIGFAVLGVWAGYYLTKRRTPEATRTNHAAIHALGLTPRELEILEALAAGQSNKEIARSLEISPNTVKTHVSSLFEKLDVNRRTQAIAEARRLGITG